MPETSDGGTNAQILLKLGEIGSDVAVIKKSLEVLPDHEQRIRQNTQDITVLKAKSDIGRDNSARWIAVGSALAAIAAGVAAWIALIHAH